MKKEEKIILEILKYKNPNLNTKLQDPKINWITVLGYLTYHRVAGLAYQNINNVRLLDYPVFFAIYSINQAQKERTKEQRLWILKISKKLREQNIKHVFLKGAILNNILFPLGARTSNDIDILITKESISKVTKILNDLGFVQGKYNYQENKIINFTNEEIKVSLQTKGETAPFIRQNTSPFLNTIDIDINFSINWDPDDKLQIVDFFLNRRFLLKKDDFEVYSLNYNDMFIELCIHLYKDCSLIDIIKKRKVLDLYKFIDIYYFIESYSQYIDIDDLTKEIADFNLEKYIYFALLAIDHLFTISTSNPIYKLYKSLKFTPDVLNIIFDQYNPSIKMISKSDFIDRIFSYDIIKKYK